MPEEELSRRRFARRQWARRWLRLRLVVISAVLALALVVGVWLVYFSSVLAVKGVDVEGNKLLTEEQVLAAADVRSGEPLARADMGAIKDRLEDLPAVASADVSREWPDRILVRVTERVAVAVVERGGTYRGIDATGFAFRSYPKMPGNLPRLKVDDDTVDEAVAEGANVLASLPTTIARKVDYVELHTVDQISLKLRDGRTIVWGSAEQSEDKAKVIAILLRQKADVYDVSVPGQPTTR
ncbi:cell division protein FtsQ [Nocardioides sp. Root151]|nr:cell division protein FtsQ [Nocardioides sp. Root140]KQZ70843.1 cell division protein FtsQ [Nocardioides sp. Root151]KRF16407.1 cell division protein FtsQ [Nocardioides sp. Soil796]